MMLAKAAILIEWVRIFVPRGTKNAFFYLSWGLVSFNTVFYAVAIIVSVASCIPTNKIWQPWVDGTCFDRRAADIATAWFNLMVDIFILVLPQNIIWKLQMSRARKLSASVVFSIGILYVQLILGAIQENTRVTNLLFSDRIIACAAGRTHSNMTLDYDGDTAYDASISFMWSFCELTGVLAVFCVPAIPKVFGRGGGNAPRVGWYTKV